MPIGDYMWGSRLAPLRHSSKQYGSNADTGPLNLSPCKAGMFGVNRTAQRYCILEWTESPLAYFLPLLLSISTNRAFRAPSISSRSSKRSELLFSTRYWWIASQACWTRWAILSGCCSRTAWSNKSFQSGEGTGESSMPVLGGDLKGYCTTAETL